MNVFLRYKDENVAKFTLSVHTGWFDVSGLKIIKKSNMPLSWNLVEKETDEKILLPFLHNWISQRVLPDYRHDLDSYIMKKLDIHHTGAGRMYGYQYITSMLSYFISPFDDFTIVPEKKEILFWGLEDETLRGVYELDASGGFRDYPLTMEKAWKLYNSIHSQYVSEVTYENNKICLKQQLYAPPEDWAYFKKTSILTKEWRFHPILQDKTAITDITKIYDNGNVVWLQEFVPLLEQGNTVREQIKNFARRVFKNESSAEVVDDIFSVHNETKSRNRELSLSECGIVYTDEGLYPIIIY